MNNNNHFMYLPCPKIHANAHLTHAQHILQFFTYFLFWQILTYCRQNQEFYIISKKNLWLCIQRT